MDVATGHPGPGAKRLRGDWTDLKIKEQIMEPGSIYTKTGDDGSTGRLFGGRVSKGDDLLEAVGAIDETVAALGFARACGVDAEVDELVLRIQRELFVVGADLSANPRARDRLVPGISEVTVELVDGLERAIDRLVESHPLRPVFVVPGATLGSAAIDLARGMVRRAERRAVVANEAGQQVSRLALVHLNRVSDLLYVLARVAAGEEPEPASHD